MARALIPLPSRDFDPTEVSVPWRALTDAGHEVVFATPDAKPGACDPWMLSGVPLGILGKHLGALPENVALYRTLERAPAFQAPIAYDAIAPSDYALLVLPGGHAKGMRPYLEDETLRARIRGFFDANKLVGAICHGGVALARSGKADGRTITALPKWMERAATLLTSWKVGDYYRTYPEYVEDECRRAVGTAGTFERGPLSNDYRAPFVVEDGDLVTARWPGDAAELARRLIAKLATRA
jgi:putative intracellular protease/amidase